MIKRKDKSAKRSKKQDSKQTNELIPVSTSLPPKVNGQLHCYLKLTVSQITWLVSNPPDITHVRVQWWGEDGSGTVFRPIDGRKQALGNFQTIARFGIRAGPKQFAAYLSDMGSLVFEVLSGASQLRVGQVKIKDVSSISPSHRIAGTYPVLSADSDKIAELKVAIELESLMASYDRSSPDSKVNYSGEFISSESPPINMPRVIPAPAVSPTSNVLGRTSKPPSGRATPMGVDAQLYSAVPEISAPADNASAVQKASVESKQLHHRAPAANAGHLNHTLPSRIEPVSVAGPGDQKNPQKDLLTSLLERGNKLREAMVVSSLDVKPNPGAAVVNKQPVEPGAKHAAFFSAPVDSDMSVDGILHGVDLSEEELKNAITAGDIGSSADDDLLSDGSLRGLSFRHRLYCMSDSEDVSDFDVELSSLLASSDKKQKRDQRSSSLNSLNDPGNQRPPSRNSSTSSQRSVEKVVVVTKKSSKEVPPQTNNNNKVKKSPKAKRRVGRSRTKKRSRSLASESDSDANGSCHSDGSASRVSFDPTPSDSEVADSLSGKPADKHSVDGLSIHRLTLLGRVHMARVLMDSLLLEDDDVDTLPTRDTNRMNAVVRGKPPTPTRAKKSKHVNVVDELYQSSLRVSQKETTEPNGIHFDPWCPSIKCVQWDELCSEVAKEIDRQRGTGFCVKFAKCEVAVNKTFFVEYQFPVVATSRDKHAPNAMATEVMRVVSTKAVGNLVSFGHRSVFPVLFDAESLEKWWKSALVFKVYRKSALQKLPKLIGMCSLPLKAVLKADGLVLDKTLEVKDRSNSSNSSINSLQSKNGHQDWPLVGQLKVLVELASDNKDFASALAKTQLAEMKNPKILPIPPPNVKMSIINGEQPTRETSAAKLSAAGGGDARGDRTQLSSGTQTEPVPTLIDRLPLEVPNERRSLRTDERLAREDDQLLYSAPPEAPTLHTLLLIPEGYNIYHEGTSVNHHLSNSKPSPLPHTATFAGTDWHGRDTTTRNLYLVSRMFWSDDVCRSAVCWGTAEPKFAFSQVAPVLLTTSLLERMRNNFMVIEVWDKKTTAHEDQLVGIVKVSLHQFYMSYRDRKVTVALLRSQYPVVSADSSLPIINPLSGVQHGQLKVTLAMGSLEQITALKQHSTEGLFAAPDRPVTYLERFHMSGSNQTAGSSAVTDSTVEHVFEVVIEGVNGLKLVDNMIWGEADSFIQYHFPSQIASHDSRGASSFGMPSMKTYRTATTLCVPDLVFNDISKHKLALPEGTPVQREILTACAGVGGGAGGIPFEVWCRYYYPNVRDQVIAKTLLPLAKLCAMVTMKKPGETSIQSFSLPLTTLTESVENGGENDDVSKFSPPVNGNLSVTINYRTNIVKADSNGLTSNSLTRTLPGAVVCIAVTIQKACGLQMAANELKRHDPSMQYAAEVGVNSYVRVRLSFLQNEDERVTRTVARTFAPEFSSQMDFPCPLLWTEAGTDALSLAEIIDSADVKFELWHQVPSTGLDKSRHHHQVPLSNKGEVTGRSLVSVAGDVLLGTVTVPLQQLLARSTGVNGWYPVNLLNSGWDHTAKQAEDHLPELSVQPQKLHRVVGGLELSVKFAHPEDRDKVIDAGQGVGWSPTFDIEHGDWTEADVSGASRCEVNVAVDAVSFPLQNALFPGQTSLKSSVSCYVRYKFYERPAVCSKLSALEQNDLYLASSMKHSKSFVITRSSPFYWYLNEERLEIQLWVTYQSDSTDARPRNRDRLIGSAYIDLESLSSTHRRQHRISNVSPLFKPGASNLGGACLTAHITLQPCSSAAVDSSDEETVGDVSRYHGSAMSGSSKKQQQQHRNGNKLTVSTGESVVDFDKTFAVHIGIERAFHLPMVLDNRQGVKPNGYVSYQTADQSELTCTDIVANSNDPVWCHENNCRLSKDLLTSDNTKFVFKVWHKPNGLNQVPDKAADKALGFVSVDLMPLTKGFPHISGFYNIIDFNGLCQGQIKVSIVPTEPLMDIEGVMSPIQPLVLGTSSVFLPTVTHWLPADQPVLASVGSPLPNFSEHLANVRRHHGELQQQMQQMNIDDPATASRSILFTTLRNNLKELDEMTAKLSRRLHSTAAADRDAHDSEGPMPLSTSSALITCGSTMLDGTWGYRSTLQSDRLDVVGVHGDSNAVPDALGMTGGSAATTDAVVEMMRCTLERTGSSLTGDQALAHSDNHERYDDVAEDADLYRQRRQADRVEELNANGDSSNIERYTDSLKHAQDLLQHLNELALNRNAMDNHRRVAPGSSPPLNSDLRRHPEPLNNDEDVEQFDENSDADEAHEDETFASVWSTRQSRTHQHHVDEDVDGDDVSGSFDSNGEQTGGNMSYVAPRTLNDVTPPHEGTAVDHSNVILSSNESAGDTWFAETENQDGLVNGNSNNNNAASLDFTDEQVAGRDAPDYSDVDDDRSAGVGRQSSPSSLDVDRRPVQGTSPAERGDDLGARSPRQQNFKSVRKMAMHRRENQAPAPLTDSSSDDGGDDESPVAGSSTVSQQYDSRLPPPAAAFRSRPRPVNPGGAAVANKPRTIDVTSFENGSKATAVQPAPEPSSGSNESDQMRTIRPVPPESSETLLPLQPSSKYSVPNFFLPQSELEYSMKTVSNRLGHHEEASDVTVESAKAAAAQELVSKLIGPKSRQQIHHQAVLSSQPQDTDQTRRIAKIFAQKFS